MNGATQAAARLVVEGLKASAPDGRGRFLREVMAHAAAGLSALEGEAVASEAVYRIGDAVVGCGGPTEKFIER